MTAPRALLLGAIAIGASVRFATLDVQSFWFDEAFTVRRVLRADLADAWLAVRSIESTPPLYYALAWPWAKLFGTGELGVRALPALLGTALVPVAFAAARELVSERAGVAAAWLTALSPLMVWYSQEARAYELLALTCGLSFLFFARLSRRGRRDDAAGFAAASAAALASHWFAVFLVAPEAAWLCVLALRQGPRGARVRRRLLAAVGGVAVAGLALLPLALEHARGGRTEWIAGLPFDTRLEEVLKGFALGEVGAVFSGPDRIVPVIAVVIAALALAGAGGAERRGTGVAAAVAAMALLMPLGAALLGADFILTRNLVGAWTPVVVVAAAGVTAPRAPRVALAAGVGICLAWAYVLGATATDPDVQRDDWRGLAESLRSSPGPQVVATRFLGSEPLLLYLPEAPTLQEPVLARAIVYADPGTPAPGGGRDFGPAPPSPGPPFMHGPGRREVAGMALTTWTAPAPAPVSRGFVEALAPPGAAATVIVDP